MLLNKGRHRVYCSGGAGGAGGAGGCRELPNVNVFVEEDSMGSSTGIFADSSSGVTSIGGHSTRGTERGIERHRCAGGVRIRVAQSGVGFAGRESLPSTCRCSGLGLYILAERYVKYNT